MQLNRLKNKKFLGWGWISSFYGLILKAEIFYFIVSSNNLQRKYHEILKCILVGTKKRFILHVKSNV